MKILILAVEITPYFVNSYVRLKKAGYELIIIDHSGKALGVDIEQELLKNQLRREICGNYSLLEIIKMARNFSPDAIVCPGWNIGRFLILCLVIRSKRVLITDSKWQATLKQKIAVRLRSLLISPFFDYAFIPGVPQEDFMRRLGFPPDKIFKGLLAVQPAPQENISIVNASRSFLYVGRNSPEKGVSRMLEGFLIYRRLSSNPFDLRVAGDGNFYSQYGDIEGVQFLGYVSNYKLSNLIQQSRALVLLSEKEPWGVVIAEALANFRPVICTDACGSSVDLVRDGVNGRVLKSPSNQDIAAAFLEMELVPDTKLSFMAEMSNKYSKIYSANSWVESLEKICS